MSKQPLQGFLIIDKPKDYTSHDVVAIIRKAIRTHHDVSKVKVGHTGTLDPFATGVLLVTVGQATRLGEYTNNLPKTYTATITLGATSDTDDIEGTLTQSTHTHIPSEQEVRNSLTTFTGPIAQVPPAYAAIKVKGKKLYEYAREGRDVERPARNVTIHSLTLTQYTYPHVSIEVVCSAGTYIRSLGRDIGENLKTGGYVSTLRRTAIGTLTEQKAISLESIKDAPITPHLHPAQELISHLPIARIDETNVAKFKNGGMVTPVKHVSSAQPVAVYSTHDTFLGIALYDPTEKVLSPQKVLTN